MSKLLNAKEIKDIMIMTLKEIQKRTNCNLPIPERLLGTMAQALECKIPEEDIREMFLEWRGIDKAAGAKPCHGCGGAGIRGYGSTSTWSGGVGGQMITSGICDKCWGSGDEASPWVNLRRLPTPKRCKCGEELTPISYICRKCGE